MIEGRADVVILAAIGDEYEAVLAVGEGAAPGSRWEEDTFHGLPVAKRVFLRRGGQPLNVVVGRAADMGRGAAVAVLRPLVDAFTPSCIAMCGVCGGHPGKTSLGDVVASERIYDYDAGKRTPRGLLADLRPYSVPATWKVALERFYSKARFRGKDWFEARPVPHEWQEHWVLWQLLHGVADPRTLPEAARLCAEWPTVIKRLWAAADVQKGTLNLTDTGRARALSLEVIHSAFPDLSPAGEVSVLPFAFHVAAIGTGSAVVEDQAVWDEIRTHMRTVTAVEMECSALAEVVRVREDLGLRAVAMKGVMDLTTDGRDDQFKPFAARAAAECLLAFLRAHLPEDVRPAERASTGSDAVEEWLRFGLDRYRRVKLVGFHDSPIGIHLDDVYVPLCIYADRERSGSRPSREVQRAEASADHDSDTLEPPGTEISFEDALANATGRCTCLALIGDPGSGKTTLLRHLFRRVKLGAFDDRLSHLRDLYPVFVRLATLTDGEMVANGLKHVIARVAADDGYPEAGNAVIAALPRRFIFLLDGLDEVRDETTRERVSAWLLDEIDHYDACAFVVTCRRAAWQQTSTLTELFVQVSVQGLHGTAINDYVDRWFRAVLTRPGNSPLDQVTDDARRHASALRAALSSEPWCSSAPLREMVSNPLMLSTICLAHYRDDHVAHRRGELYERALGLLIEVWPRNRPGTTSLQLETTRAILQPLAYAMHKLRRRELSFDEAAALVQPLLDREPAVRAVAPTAAEFLDLAGDGECGVLISEAPGRIEFVHDSFQDYLAACHVSTRGLGAELVDRAGDPQWAEVILLAMSRPGVFEPFMTGALQRMDIDDALIRHCLREVPKVSATPFEEAADRALDRLRSPDGPIKRIFRRILGLPEPAPATDELRRLLALVHGYPLPGMVARARQFIDSDDVGLRAVARRLVGLEDATPTTPREGQPFVHPTTGMVFVWIPPGDFLMGSSKRPSEAHYDEAADDDEAPAHDVRLTGFWIGVYPVTNQQYARFVAATTREAPVTFADRGFNDPAQPVVTVSWHDARAFAQWMTSELGGDLAGTVARLPTEAEWEYAARGKESHHHRYPWGTDLPDRSRATMEGVAGPAVVGSTPAGVSPFGVHDLAGNVYEWCLDVGIATYAEMGASAGRVDPYRHGLGGTPVIRGGSWRDGARHLRAAYRARLDAEGLHHHVGFRVVVGGAREPTPR